MKAVVFDAYGELPTVREWPEPTCPADGAVISVRATGVCRSDWHAWRGHDPVSMPHVPGHEFAGVILHVGSDVTHFAPGQRVTTPFVNGCGRCEQCLAGDANVCPNQTQPGFTGPGSFAEQVVVHAADVNLVALPDSIDFVTAASLGCRFATAYRAVTVHGRVRAGDWLAVFGCGGVGLSAVLIGVALGARVLAIDPSTAARSRAAQLGATQTLDLAADLAEHIRHITAGGAHVTLDAIGLPAIAASAVRSLRRRGRHLQVGLLLGENADAALPMDLVISSELEIYGSHGMAARDYPVMLEQIGSGRLRPADLVGAVISLDQAGHALAAMDGPSAAGMTVVQLNPENS